MRPREILQWVTEAGPKVEAGMEGMCVFRVVLCCRQARPLGGMLLDYFYLLVCRTTGKDCWNIFLVKRNVSTARSGFGLEGMYEAKPKGFFERTSRKRKEG